LPEPPPAIRRFEPEDVHMTLAFLGGCGEAAAERALARLDVEFARSPMAGFEVSLGEVVPMGARPRYTALSALLVEGRAEATRWLTELGGTLCETAIGRRPSRPAKPHVTLARPRPRAKDADRAAGLSWANALDLASVRQFLPRIALYTWSEVRSKRLFRIVAERTLGPAR
jgi:RNA 2',3'-cyclic 3'-phosphodiesterase